MFDIRLFNGKSEAVGLHALTVEFCKGGWWSKRIVSRDDHSEHFVLALRNHAPLTEMDLPSRLWASEHVSGIVREYAPLLDCDSVWLTAQTAQGRRKRWLVTRMGRGRKP
jgi:hypothetical protein